MTMKMKTLRGSAAVALTLALSSWIAGAQSSNDDQSNAGGTATGASGMMGGDGMMSGHGMMHGQGTMQNERMTPEMRQRGHMLMNATLTREDPGAILGLKEQIGLTDEQIAKLHALQETARKQARATLTDDQRAQLEELPAGSGSMAQMYTHMQQMYGAQGETSSTGVPCPMMQMMMGDMSRAGQHQAHHAE